MKQIDINIYDVKNYIYNLLKGKVSTNVFPSMPKEINAAWTDFVSIEMPQMSTNRAAYGVVTVWVIAYAKDVTNGVVDSNKLFNMQNQINNIFNETVNSANNKYIIQKWESMEVTNPQIPKFSGIMTEVKLTII